MATGNPAALTVPLAERTEAELRSRLEAAEVDPYAVEQLCWLLGYAREHNLSLKALAVKTGLTDGSVSQLFNAAYPGNYILRARKIEQFRMEDAKAALFGGRDDFVATEVARNLWLILDRTRYSRRIQIVQSVEQLGKSCSCREYARQNNGGRTIMVTLQPGMGGNPLGIFLRDVAVAAGASGNIHRKLMDVRLDVRDALAVCDLMVIDEFHQVEHWPDKAVRDLLDFIRTEAHADGKRGVSLIATNSDVLTLLQAFRRRTRYNLGQLLGRMCNEILEITADEIPESDVRLLVERYYHPGKRCLEKLHELTTRPHHGHIGLLLDILNRAWTDCKLGDSAMSDELVLSIARETMDDIAEKEKRLQLRR